MISHRKSGQVGVYPLTWLVLMWLKVVSTLVTWHSYEEFISASPIMDIMRSQLLGSHHIIGIIKQDSNPPHTCMPTNAFVVHSLSIFQRTLKWRIGASIHCTISWFDAPCMIAHDCISLSKEFANYLIIRANIRKVSNSCKFFLYPQQDSNL